MAGHIFFLDCKNIIDWSLLQMAHGQVLFNHLLTCTRCGDTVNRLSMQLQRHAG